MIKYIAQVEFSTLESVSLKALPSILSGKLKDGSAMVFSVAVAEKCEDCGEDKEEIDSPSCYACGDKMYGDNDGK